MRLRKKIIVLSSIALVLVIVGILIFSFRGFIPGYFPKEVTNSSLDKIKLPPGFKIDFYAKNIPGARSMTQSDAGTLFIGTRDEGKVYAIAKNKTIYTIASGLNMPNGVAFQNGSLYVAEVTRIIRFDDIENRLDNPPSPIVVIDKFPSDLHHGWKFIRFGPDGKLYVPVGAPCNICDPGDPYAAITRMNPDGSNFEIYARGIRNTVGFDWDSSREMWFTDNGRDLLGDNIPPDELNHITLPDQNFGYPFCHGSNITDPIFKSRPCDEFEKPAIELGPHVASLGMRFYTGKSFPDYYKNGIFIAEHGSWNRNEPIGYRVTFVRVENGIPKSYEVFAQGWLDGVAFGRPVDIEILPDGSMLVSEDKAGAIYRIYYEK